ncbi:hypothetical protein OK016_29940 [Vibrio chagasii]|nr:hypothetical protein [Vibrio chagasii]
MRCNVKSMCFAPDEPKIDGIESELGHGPTVTSDHDIEFDYSHMLTSDFRWYRGDLHAHTQLSDGHNIFGRAKDIVESQVARFLFLH